MAVVSKPPTDFRWKRTLRGAAALADDLDSIGLWVGRRTGAMKRTHGQKEDYVLRRLIVAWWRTGLLEFPAEIWASREQPKQPDFLIRLAGGEVAGVEITEAGEEEYQAWLTAGERGEGSKGLRDDPLDLSTERTAAEIVRAIKTKVDKFDGGAYRAVSWCDLAVYDNTASGGFLDKRDVIRAIARPNALLNRFRQIHLVTDGVVYLNLFEEDHVRSVDVRNLYEVDYVAWLRDQVERLRRRDVNGLDFEHIAEELESLAARDRRAVRSHICNLLLHLLKWEYQPARRSHSWLRSIGNARSKLADIQLDSPSLADDEFLLGTIQGQYARARRDALLETGLSDGDIPKLCPFSFDQLFDSDYPALDALKKD